MDFVVTHSGSGCRRLRQKFGDAVALISCFMALASISLAQANLQSQRANRQDASSLYDEARKALEKDDYSTAIEAYRKLLRIDGRSASLFLQLGVAQYQNGDYDSATASLQRALALRSNLPEAEAFLGLAEDALGHGNVSLPLLEKSFRSSDSEIGPELNRMVGIHLGRLYYKTGRSLQAESVYLVLLEKYPDDADVLYESFWLRFSRAREIMKIMLEKNPNSYLTHKMLGHLLLKRHDYHAAAEQFRVALKENPSVIGLHYDLGNVLAASGDEQASKAEFEEELRLHPSHAGSLCQLGEIAMRSGEMERARELYNEALKGDPRYADALLGLTKVYMSRNDLPQALDYCLTALKIDPENRSGHYLLSRIYKSLGRISESNAEMQIFKQLQTKAAEESNYLAAAEAGTSSQ